MIAFHIFYFSFSSLPVLNDLGVMSQFYEHLKSAPCFVISFIMRKQPYKKRFFFVFDLTKILTGFSFLVYLGEMEWTGFYVVHMKKNKRILLIF